MNPDIDLTVNQDFASHKLYKEKETRYPHRKLPWEYGTDDQPVPLNSNKNNSYTWNKFSNGTFNIHEVYSNLNVTFESIFSDDDILSYYGSYYSGDNSYYLKFTDTLTTDKKYEDFPTGHKEEIIRKRIPVDKTDNSYHIYARKRNHDMWCKNCNKHIVDTPWNRQSYYKQPHGASVFSEEPQQLCFECDERQEQLKKFRKRRDAYNLYKHQKIYGLNHPFHSVYSQDNRYWWGTVPCLSSDVPMNEKLQRLPYHFNEIYKFYDTIPCGMKEIRDDIQEEKSRRIRTDHPSLMKGKKKINHVDPLQPYGRNRQDYDRWFDQLDWRDSLKLRIGEPVEYESPDDRINRIYHEILDETEFIELL